MANTQIKQHIPIFISSTYEDLIPYRDEVQRNLIRLEQIVKGMEYFGSSPKNPLSECLSQIKDCKLYIGIIGMRYGSIDEDSGLSYTQIEYNEAINQGIPTLIYIIDETHPIPPKFVDKGEDAAKLEKFKSELKKKHTVSFFSTPDDLGKKVSKDLIDALSALNDVDIDSKKANDIQKENIFDLIKKFWLRPAKYQGIEGKLKMRVNTQLAGYTLKNDIVKAFGLELGNTLSVDVDILDFDEPNINKQMFNVNFINNLTLNDIITAKVKTAFCEIKELNNWDEGRILKTTTYTGLIITEGISIDKE